MPSEDQGSFESLSKQLQAHEARSEWRYDELCKQISTKSEDEMGTENINVGDGGALGGGLGTGLMGGILGSVLLGNGGLLGRNGVGDGIVTPALLAASLNQVQDNTANNIAASERLNMARFDADSQREIQAAVERTAAATQLASATQAAALGVEIAKGAGETNTQIALTTGNLGTQSALNAAAIQTQAAKQAGDLSTQIALNTAAVATAVERTGTATALAFKDSAILAQANTSSLSQQLANTQFALSTAVKADGDLTRSLIIANNDAMLNRQLATAQAEIIELRHHEHSNRRARETEVNVTQTVNQTQAQAQAQAQQQQQLQALIELGACVRNLAGDIQAVRQTQSNVNFGVQGTAGQTASAANTRVN